MPARAFIDSDAALKAANPGRGLCRNAREGIY